MPSALAINEPTVEFDFLDSGDWDPGSWSIQSPSPKFKHANNLFVQPPHLNNSR
jgi:hypothetical protein